MKQTISIFFIIFFIGYAHAQIGIPEIKNFSSEDYKGGTQNWEIGQDKSQIMYFANNEGLITYNGKYWHNYPLPNKTVVRSFKIDEDGKIYVGGQDEIGYFFPDANGVLKYHSLKSLIPKNERQLEDIWDIVILKKEIYFRTNSKILLLKNGVFSIYKSDASWEYLGLVNNQIYAQDIARGLLAFKNNTWETIAVPNNFEEASITSILPFSGDSLLMTSNKNGIFIISRNGISKIKSQDQYVFSNSRIYDAVKVNSNLYAFATVSSGCLIVNKRGQIVQKFTSSEGLQKNNLRCIFQDKNQNLWLGLDDGIDFVAFNNAIKYIYPDKTKQTSSYATKIIDNKLYVGTSNGLFNANLNIQNKDISYSNEPFSETASIQGQIWNLNILNKKLLISSEEGAYEISDSKIKSLYRLPGTWMFEPLSAYSPSKEIVAGTYNGLVFLNYLENGQFSNKREITGINESLRFLVYDSSTDAIWASHPYRGIYKFKLNGSKTDILEKQLFTVKDGLPSSLGNYVAKIKNRIVVATIKGIYEFEEQEKKFTPSKTFKPVFGNMNVQYFKEDQYGNIWFVSNKHVGVVDFNRKENGKGFSIIYFPELTSKVLAGFENIYPYNQQNVFIGANKGLIHINYLNYVKNIKQLNVNLTLVKISGEKDSILFGGYFLSKNHVSEKQDDNQNISLKHQYNSLHFEYSSTLYEQQNNIEFSYKLSGFDNKWSEWNAKSEKDYTNLPPGGYEFCVKARNNLGSESAAVTYKFTIAPAWYQTWIFYLVCFLMVCLIIYLLIQRQKRKHLKEQEYLRKTHLLEIEHNEKEIVKLRNDKLEADVNFKNKELATATMHLMQRGKLILKIKEELLPIVKTENIEESPEEFKKILSLIKDAERADSDWEHFSVHFDHVHANFLSKLKEQIPSLSANDLKLCAYLKMNLTSKEIAQLMSVTVRAVEVSRYRLRKKLDVSTDTNLFNYLMEITGN
ncbi:transcriptional regulator [Pedobacter psychrophilus]|uniref:Transcriptional regulator n=1 Tax=Pedobacter psychrophilus TaxID=1826909 RepID=A0A179DEA8_9SPHI|nr:triple tyrosine motif-containing protein [Pedobacter psychrophilus]OAQ39234.1 transcriptional regulator [Pedobacter psychrophilus]